MAFFGKSLAPRKIDVDTESTSANSPEMQKRLDRIETNYSKLEEILLQLETRFEMDDRLAAEHQNDVDQLRKIRKKKPR